MIRQIFLPFYLGGGGKMGDGEQPFPWIHIKDLTGIIEHSIENKNVEGVLNGKKRIFSAGLPTVAKKKGLQFSTRIF